MGWGGGDEEEDASAFAVYAFILQVPRMRAQVLPYCSLGSEVHAVARCSPSRMRSKPSKERGG